MKSETGDSILLSFCPGRLQASMAIVGLVGFLFVGRIWLFAGVFTGSFIGRPGAGWRMDLTLLLPLALIGAIIWRLVQLNRGDRAALRATPDGLEATSFFRRRTIAWRDLLGAQEVLYGFGFYTRRALNVRSLHDGAHRTIRVPLILTQRPRGGPRAITEAVEAAQARALGGKPAAAGQGTDGPIDADAAIARYLAQKQAEAERLAAEGAPVLPPGPARPAFGRKGL